MRVARVECDAAIVINIFLFPITKTNDEARALWQFLEWNHRIAAKGVLARKWICGSFTTLWPAPRVPSIIFFVRARVVNNQQRFGGRVLGLERLRNARRLCFLSGMCGAQCFAGYVSDSVGNTEHKHGRGCAISKHSDKVDFAWHVVTHLKESLNGFRASTLRAASIEYYNKMAHS